MNSRVTAVVVMAAACLLGSCSRISGKLLIMEANFLASRGRHNEAAMAYLRALGDQDAAPYAEYGLGSAYYALDEDRAALERFADLRQMLETLPLDEHRELRYRLQYNTGVVLFGRGDFPGAAGYFREALRIDPGRIEAKRNLELSLRSIARKNSAGGQAEQRQTESESRAALFDYIRQKETGQWQSRDWGEEEPITGPDY
jgi:Ca-activated chloride channel family protein